MTHSKECFKCKTIKPLDEFYKHSKMVDGHVNKCKVCNKNDVTNNRNAKIDYYRAYDLKRSKEPERYKAAAAISASWRKQDKRRMQCHNAVTRAIRSGKLIKKPCIRCGNEKSLAHHEDYDQPLLVMWLCQPCHKQRHKEILLINK
jgi:ribosomal protein S27AE